MQPELKIVVSNEAPAPEGMPVAPEAMPSRAHETKDAHAESQKIYAA